MFNWGTRSIRLIVVLSLILAGLLAFDLIPFLRGGFGWQWPYNPVSAGSFLLIAVLIYLLGCWFWLQKTDRAVFMVLWAFFGAFLIPLFVIQLRSPDVVYELFARTVSGVTTGPHMAGAEVDWASGNWRDWVAIMNRFEGRSVHVALSPPGLPLWYGLLNSVIGTAPEVANGLQRTLLPYQCHNWNLLAYTPAEWASAWFGMLMPLWAACTVFPLYRIAHRLLGKDGTPVVLWWPLVPALVMFVPTWNTFYPFICLVAFALFLGALDNRPQTLRLLVAGLLIGLLIFANFSLIPVIALFGFYTLLHCFWVEKQSFSPANWVRPVRIGLIFGFGLAIPWLIYGLWSGLTPFTLAQTAMTAHLSLDRPYLPWLWLHLWEWALFTGIPLILLWLVGVWREVRLSDSTRSVLGLSLFLTMLFLLLSGTARGETGRVWLFFSPFVLITAYGALIRLVKISSRPVISWAAVSLAQVTMMLVLAFTWNVMGAPDITPRPEAPVLVAAERPGGAIFDNTFQLIGWDAVAQNNIVELRLNWQGLQTMTVPYWFSALLVDPQGNPVSEAVVWQPSETRYPTTCWEVGAQLGDTVSLPLPTDAPSGEWWISLSAFQYDSESLDRLSVQLPDGSSDTQIGLGPVSVPG
ncbi:MAG: hypothetical protein K8L97_15265 [Anaerolineae bacterium]|nr:hypothetical protein [Anaerolineae bacterium]